jgi:hypothetical protein
VPLKWRGSRVVNRWKFYVPITRYPNYPSTPIRVWVSATHVRVCIAISFWPTKVRACTERTK